jgi:hypothetical protein
MRVPQVESNCTRSSDVIDSQESAENTCLAVNQ